MSFEQYRTEAECIHREVMVVAAHTDVIGDVAERQSKGETAVLATRHAETFKRPGINCISEHVIGDTFETQRFPTGDILRSLYGGQIYNPTRLKHALKCLTHMLRDLDQSAEEFTLALSVCQIREIAASGKIAVVLCTQGLGPVENDEELLRTYVRLGIRVLGIVTRPPNAAAGTYFDNQDYGLTSFGRRIIDLARQLRLLVDVSAVSEKGFWDLVDCIDGPICASCTNASRVCDHPGNFNDDQIKAVAQKGGFIGLIANGEMVSTRTPPTLANFVDHIDHIVEVAGVDHVCIGPDIVEDSFYPVETYRRIFADQGFWSAQYPVGFCSHPEWPNVTAELLRRGYRRGDIAKILGENVLRVYERVWGA